MRFKSWPYYKDWTEIFGKDRATGEHAESLIDAVNAIEKENGAIEVNSDDEVEEITSIPDTKDHSTPDTSKEAQDKKKNSGKKRKVRSGYESNGLFAVADALGNFTEKTEDRLGMLAERIGYEHNMSLARKQVYPSLENMSWLSEEEKLTVASRITSNNHNIDLYLSVPEECKTAMVKMILEGKIMKN